ncbi:hypothetical protein ACFXJJ_32645, partial [Streptomyces sp. NPDC059233]
AVKEQYHWANVLGDFTDDFYELPCPHCAAEVTIAIGGYGRYAAIRDWDLGDTDRRELRPSPAEELSGVGRWMYEIAVRDGEDLLADGISIFSARPSVRPVPVSSPSRTSTRLRTAPSCGSTGWRWPLPHPCPLKGSPLPCRLRDDTSRCRVGKFTE